MKPLEPTSRAARVIGGAIGIVLLLCVLWLAHGGGVTGEQAQAVETMFVFAAAGAGVVILWRRRRDRRR
ncbi:MAG: hypothetical protein H6708_24435 [Kofleriaceae bacterium]|nr:hypothetical protein [Kofleriaceae bacterium]